MGNNSTKIGKEACGVKPKKMTQAVRMQCRMRATMLQVIEELGWTEQQYCEFKFKTGLAYADLSTYGDPFSASVLYLSAKWWGWFKTMWYNRDEAWVNDMWRLELAKTMHPEGLKLHKRMAYKQYHDAMALADGAGPWGKEMEDSFCEEQPI